MARLFKMGTLSLALMVALALQGQNASNLVPRSSFYSQALKANRLGLLGRFVDIHQWEAAEKDMRFFPDTSLPALKGTLFIYSDTFAVSHHATRLAQLMVGQELAHQPAGIAPKARLHVHDIIDYKTQVQVYAEHGMQISLHAYNQNLGWSRETLPFWGGLEAIDSTEDFHWGRYTQDSRWWDSLAHRYPELLVVRSAGNSLGEYFEGEHLLYAPFQKLNGKQDYRLKRSKKVRDSDGGFPAFDCLTPDAVTKNGLTVGAVWPSPEGDLQLVANSSVGPTDDGRVKPDVVAVGEQTSESAAAVAAGLALLTEYYQLNYTHKPPAHLLKNFLISGAEDLDGMPGPDYKSGWGAVNLERSVDLINPRSFQLLKIAPKDTLVLLLSPFNENIRATLVWTDLPGEPVPFSLAPSILNNRKNLLRLDLDMWLVVKTQPQKVHLPFVLDPIHPARPAQKGKNKIDNVEQVALSSSTKEGVRVFIVNNASVAVSASLVLKGAHFNYAPQ